MEGEWVNVCINEELDKRVDGLMDS